MVLPQYYQTSFYQTFPKKVKQNRRNLESRKETHIDTMKPSIPPSLSSLHREQFFYHFLANLPEVFTELVTSRDPLQMGTGRNPGTLVH